MEQVVPSISVVELLQSGLMSDSVLFLEHESTTVFSPLGAAPLAVPVTNGNVKCSNVFGDERNDVQSKERRQAMENAVRLALLLTRSFVNFVSQTISGTSPEDKLRYLSSLQLTDFSIKLLERSSTNDGDQAAAAHNAWTLLKMEIMEVDSSQKQQRKLRQQSESTQGPNQILGELLYSIFSLDGPPAFDMLKAAEPATQQTSEEKDNHHQPTKNFRVTKVSLFSKLVETKVFPISICRFLSDLIDTGPGGKADSPFASLRDVLQDLEQILSQPLIFLHDENYPLGVPQPPTFGQIHHGRKEELTTLVNVAVQMEGSLILEGDVDVNVVAACPQKSNAVFVSGKAGVGKSKLVHMAGECLAGLGWIVIHAKFERNTEHASKRIMSSMFDQLIVKLVKMKEGGVPSDIEYIDRISKSIVDSIGHEGLSRLETFMPSIPFLFGEVSHNRSVSPEEMHKNLEETKNSDGQNLYFLTKLLDVILEDRFLMICADDLQWADETSLSFITNVLVNVGSIKNKNQHCLFVGLYRQDEVDGEHPFSIQQSYLQMNSNICTSEINLSTFSKDHVVDMLMLEFKLPRRVVAELANLVYKKTAGHMIFVVQLLNQLLSNSTISYSSEKHRYNWDPCSIDCMQTGQSVAELIASNISSLPPESQRILHILSCFGIQTDISLLEILERFQNGILSSIDAFVESGVLDRGGPILIFTHDLIQQAVYESMPVDQRRALHHDIGLFLGTNARADSVLSLAGGVGKLQMNKQHFYVDMSVDSSLIAIACDQVNAAGPDATSNENQKLKFAEWNLEGGHKLRSRGNFRAALYYFSNGIKFLGEECWCVDHQLSLELHEGAFLASFAIGEGDQVARYVEEVIKHAPFEDTLLAQQVNLRNLTQMGQHETCIATGIEILSRLGVDIPLSPTRESIVIALATTNVVTSQYDAEQILSLCVSKFDDSSQFNFVKITEAFYGACYSSSSRYVLPITCEILKFSLKNGICPESTCAFASYAMLKVAVEGDYTAGKYWATMTRAILKKLKDNSKSRRLGFNGTAQVILLGTVDIWFHSPRDISLALLQLRNDALKAGEGDFAMMSLDFAWRYKLLGGEKLSIILQSAEDRFKLVMEHIKKSELSYVKNKSKMSFKPYTLLDGVLLTKLTGKSVNFLSCDLNDLEAEAESTKNARLLYHTHVYNMLLGFWFGDYLAAEKFFHRAMSSPSAKKPEILLIYHSFYGGLVAFNLYRHEGGSERLKEGRATIDKMRIFSQNSMAVFENKWLLLKAEYQASFVGNGDETDQLYRASIKAARDQGNIHELGLAYELFGNCHAARGNTSESKDCYNNAYVYYEQWGATAVAQNLFRKHNLENNLVANKSELPSGRAKHGREWD